MMSLDSLPNHQCYICDKTFSCVSTQRRHLRQIHHVETDDLAFIRKQLKCSICRIFTCISSHEMNSHLSHTHGVVINVEIMVFSSLEEFEKWKVEMERRTNTSFVKHAGAQKLDDGSKYYQYICSRSGNYSPKGTGKRRLKKQGSRKINAYCPAKIIMKHFTEDGCILVEFNTSHCGHQMEIHHLNLTEADKQALAHNLTRNIPIDCILDSVRNRASEPLGRLHLLTKKDLQNIKKRFSIGEDNRNKNHLKNVEAWATDLVSRKENNTVLLFKPLSVKDGHSELGHEDFFLAIMTAKQLEILKKYGHDCVVIDSIQGTNVCGYEFTAIMVVNDQQEGIVVAFLYCNHKNQLTYEVFFKAIKNRAGVVSPTVFMSDDNDAVHAAWTSVMGKVPRRLLCSWHVDSFWRSKLPLIDQKEKQVHVYKCIRMLLEETNIEKFNRIAPVIAEELLQDLNTMEFGKCFFENFMNRVSIWAHCYRSEPEIRSGASLERLHDKLKTLHLKRKKPKAFERSIQALIQFVENPNGTAPFIVPNEKNVNDDHSVIWVESSNGGDNNMFEIAQCCEDPTCSLKCDECNVCIHAFVNPCRDLSTVWTMCKHIQVVPGVLCESSVNLEDSNETVVRSVSIGSKDDEMNSIEVKFDLCKEGWQTESVRIDETKRYMHDQFNSLLSMCLTEQHANILEGILCTAFVAFDALEK